MAHAIEQGLIQALVSCLTAASHRIDGLGNRHHANTMVRFEEVLAEHLFEPLRMPELSQLVGVTTQRNLRLRCSEFLGVSPTRYLLLRRLNRARITLRDAGPERAGLAGLARSPGFAEPARFTAAYQAAFGETPLTTLQRAPLTRFVTP